MKEQKEWIPYTDIDWNDPENNRFNIDTRDFHAGYKFSDENHKDWKTISKYDHFFFTKDELISLIDRLFVESGGKGNWRMLDLKHNDSRVKNWSLKYLRIFRTEKGFLVCNTGYDALPKKILVAAVNKEYLAHH